MCVTGIFAAAGVITGAIDWAVNNEHLDVTGMDFADVVKDIGDECLGDDACQTQLQEGAKQLAEWARQQSAGQWAIFLASAIAAHVVTSHLLDKMVTDAWDMMKNDPEFAKEVGWTGGPLTLGLVNDLPFEVEIASMRTTDGYLWRYPGLTGHTFYPDSEAIFQLNSGVFDCDVGLEMTLRFKDCANSMISFAVRRLKCFNSWKCERIRLKINGGSTKPQRGDLCERESVTKFDDYSVLAKLSDMVRGRVPVGC